MVTVNFNAKRVRDLTPEDLSFNGIINRLVQTAMPYEKKQRVMSSPSTPEEPSPEPVHGIDVSGNEAHSVGDTGGGVDWTAEELVDRPPSSI